MAIVLEHLRPRRESQDADILTSCESGEAVESTVAVHSKMQIRLGKGRNNSETSIAEVENLVL